MFGFNKKTLIYADKAGNKLFEDIDQRVVLLNKKGRLVRTKDIRPFIRQPKVKQAITKFYNQEIKFKVLNPVQTKDIKPKVKGGIYK